jgi:hypothetical protein
MIETERLNSDLDRQVRVSRMLGLAFALSITGIGGLGSLFALMLGVKARRIIRKSDVPIAGGMMAWWCIFLGALGTLILTPRNIMLVVKALR